ncbi:MAG: MoaD/ThiS family protein [Thiobacillaceae bacterium]|jgi:molybdopterin converting factor small subunit
MKIRILYFGRIVDVAGVTSENLELPPAINSSEKLLKLLSMRGKEWKLAIQDNPKLRITINKEMPEGSAELKAGDEVGLVAF